VHNLAVTSPADAIPDLERLMRDVLRDVFEGTLGDGWLASGLSRSVREGIERAGNLARSQRPTEALRDDWDAVGLAEMAASLRSVWQQLDGALDSLWPDPHAASVDLDRLIAYRGKNLHAVGPPGGQIRDDEIGAMILRLRVGFESVRRRLANEEGEWWPYVEAIHSNIPEFCWDRTSGPYIPSRPLLFEDDLVTFSVVGVHPNGPQERLRYRVYVGTSGWDSDWTADSTFSVSVPRWTNVTFSIAVADVDDLDLKRSGGQNFSCRVRPKAG
jgi:hypothetical protein